MNPPARGGRGGRGGGGGGSSSGRGAYRGGSARGGRDNSSRESGGSFNNYEVSTITYERDCRTCFGV
jgi:hypothetical protein